MKTKAKSDPFLAFFDPVDGESLLAAADWAEEEGQANAAQLRSLGRALLAAPGALAEASAYAAKHYTPRQLLGLLTSDQRQRRRLAAVGPHHGWFTDGRLAWRPLDEMTLQYLEATAGDAEPRDMPNALPLNRGWEIVWADVFTDGTKQQIINTADGARFMLWRVLVMLKRLPRALWLHGSINPACLVEGDVVNGLLMPTS